MSGKGRGRGRGRGAVNFDALKKPGVSHSETVSTVKNDLHSKNQNQKQNAETRSVQQLYNQHQQPKQPQQPPCPIVNCSHQPKPPAASQPVTSAPSMAISDKDKLLISVTRLPLHASPKDLETVVDECKIYADSVEERYLDVARAVYGRCQVDWQFSRTAAVLCQLLCSLPDVGNNFRIMFLNIIQSDFKEKDNLRIKSIQNYLGCISFLCQLFNNLRTADGQVFQALIIPVFEALESLLDNRADTPNIECAAEQLLTVGRSLQSSNSDRLRRLIQTVRDFIIDSRGSRESRLSLIKVLECNSSDWEIHSLEACKP